MIEFLTGWAALGVALGIILLVLYLVLKMFASFGDRTINSAFFAAVFFGGLFVALAYIWCLLIGFLIETGFDAIKLLVVLIVGALFTALWVCLEFLFLWICANAFGR
jgi:hypothetical protein